LISQLISVGAPSEHILFEKWCYHILRTLHGPLALL
jgi:hypothetical protein